MEFGLLRTAYFRLFLKNIKQGSRSLVGAHLSGKNLLLSFRNGRLNFFMIVKIASQFPVDAVVHSLDHLFISFTPEIITASSRIMMISLYYISNICYSVFKDRVCRGVRPPALQQVIVLLFRCSVNQFLDVSLLRRGGLYASALSKSTFSESFFKHFLKAT